MVTDPIFVPSLVGDAVCCAMYIYFLTLCAGVY